MSLKLVSQMTKSANYISSSYQLLKYLMRKNLKAIIQRRGYRMT